MKRVVCRCGHVGRSNLHEHYRCSACDYAGRANGAIAKANELRARAAKLEKDAERYRAKAEAFARKHPGSGPDDLRK